MKLSTFLHYSCAFTIMALPLSAVNESVSIKTDHHLTVIEKINPENVEAARASCASEAFWSPIIRTTCWTATTAAICYGLYKWCTTPSPISLQESEVAQLRYLLKRDNESNFKNLNIPFQPTLADQSTWFQNYVTGPAASIGSYIALNTLLTMGTTLASNGIASISTSLPSTGTLEWYMIARTEYARNIQDIKRYIGYYDIFKHETHAVIQAIVNDVEKILGYVHYFKEHLESKKIVIKNHVTTCARYAATLEMLTNKLVDVCNTSNANLQTIVEHLQLVDAEINSAKAFVKANYR